MKLFSALLLSTAALSASAKDVVVALSPHQDQASAKQQFNDVVSIYTKLELGDRLVVINGSDASTIATFNIPEKTGYKHPKARLRLGAKEIVKLQRFTKQVSQSTRTLGAMDTPLVLNQITRNYPNATEILLIGSALYDSPQQPGVDMTSMLVPSDGLITAKPIDSPFGVIGREKQLQGKRIHWLLPNASNGSLHSEALLRFWHLYIHQMGGSLISFTPNNDAVIRLLLGNAQPLPMEYQLDTSGKKYMQGIRKLVPETSLYQQPVSEEQPDKSIFDTRQTLIVGIEWQGKGVDLDIYAKPQGGETLSYLNSSSAEGKHYKDLLSGRTNADATQYETIEFHAPIDPRTLVIGVNAFSTGQEPPPINGTLRLQLAGQTYTRSFIFEVSEGNVGKDIVAVLNNGKDTAHSKQFTIMDIVGSVEVEL